MFLIKHNHTSSHCFHTQIVFFSGVVRQIIYRNNQHLRPQCNSTFITKILVLSILMVVSKTSSKLGLLTQFDVQQFSRPQCLWCALAIIANSNRAIKTHFQFVGAKGFVYLFFSDHRQWSATTNTQKPCDKRGSQGQANFMMAPQRRNMFLV